MRPSFPELMHGLFWLAMAVVLILFALRAFTMMDLLEKRMQQSTIHHEKLMAQHDAMMQRLAR
jgi:hypothetical protein